MDIKNNTDGHFLLTPDFKNQAWAKALQLVEKYIAHIPEYIANKINLNNLPVTVEGENDISAEICNYFNSLGDNLKTVDIINENELYLFCLTHQITDESGAMRSNDMGISVIKRKNNGLPMAGTTPILRIEAKRLPTPGSSRKKEYVEGNLGGIERFKMGVHSHETPEAIMLAYIQKHDAAHWHTQVNTWIDEQITTSSNPTLTWAKQDKLQHKTTIGTVEKYHSTHKRINSLSNEIELHHYWLPLK